MDINRRCSLRPPLRLSELLTREKSTYRLERRAPSPVRWWTVAELRWVYRPALFWLVWHWDGCYPSVRFRPNHASVWCRWHSLSLPSTVLRSELIVLRVNIIVDGVGVWIDLVVINRAIPLSFRRVSFDRRQLIHLRIRWAFPRECFFSLQSLEFRKEFGLLLHSAIEEGISWSEESLSIGTSWSFFGSAWHDWDRVFTLSVSSCRALISQRYSASPAFGFLRDSFFCGGGADEEHSVALGLSAETGCPTHP